MENIQKLILMCIRNNWEIQFCTVGFTRVTINASEEIPNSKLSILRYLSFVAL